MYIHSLQKKKLTFYQGSLKAEAERKWVPKKKKKNLPILRYGEREREKGEKSTLFTSVFLTFFLSKKNPSHTTIEAISSHQTPLGEKKKKKKKDLRHTGDSIDHRYPLLSFPGTFFSLSLSFFLWFFVVLIRFWNFSVISG